MPELPEVETIKRSLAANLTGAKIVGTDIHYSGNIKQPDPPVFQALLQERVFRRVDRRGKYLLLSLSGDLVLVVHLRMTGKLLYLPAEEPMEKHTHLIFHLEGGHDLRYVDARKFGTLNLLPLAELASLKGLSQLGREPLSAEFTLAWLQDCLVNRKRPIKSFLLDQKVIAGIGNIYADEILFEAGIHPQADCSQLPPAKIAQLHRAAIEILELGITHRGTSIRDYVDGDSRQGGFQELLRVYGRGGEPCVHCGLPIIKVKLAGRGTHYCSRCQALD